MRVDNEELNGRLVRIEQDVQEILRQLAGAHVEPFTLPVPGERTAGLLPLGEQLLTVSEDPSCACKQCRATLAVLTDRGVLCPGCANNL
jgi:hypothetical protein